MLDDIPNCLFPIISNKGIKSPIRGPDTYHGHGSLIKSIIIYKVVGQINSEIGNPASSTIALNPPATSITFL